MIEYIHQHGEDFLIIPKPGGSYVVACRIDKDNDGQWFWYIGHISFKDVKSAKIWIDADCPGPQSREEKCDKVPF